MSDIIPFFTYPDKIPFMGGHNPLHVLARLDKIPFTTRTKSPCFIGFLCIIMLQKY
jgi:hypothetical protein